VSLDGIWEGGVDGCGEAITGGGLVWVVVSVRISSRPVDHPDPSGVKRIIFT